MIAVSSSAIFTPVHEEMRRGGEGPRSAVRYSLSCGCELEAYASPETATGCSLTGLGKAEQD